MLKSLQNDIMKTILLMMYIALVCPDFNFINNTQSENYTDEDVHWLALNIYHEARSERQLRDKLAVAFVTLNRVNSDNYPHTIKSVVTDPHQFSWYWDDNPIQPKEKDAWEECKEIAELALSIYTPGRLQGASHYHAKYTNPYWAKDMTLVAIRGTHRFYKNDN